MRFFHNINSNYVGIKTFSVILMPSPVGHVRTSNENAHWVSSRCAIKVLRLYLSHELDCTSISKTFIVIHLLDSYPSSNAKYLTRDIKIGGNRMRRPILNVVIYSLFFE